MEQSGREAARGRSLGGCAEMLRDPDITRIITIGTLKRNIVSGSMSVLARSPSGAILCPGGFVFGCLCVRIFPSSNYLAGNLILASLFLL